MRRLLLACLFFLAVLPALAATVTTKYSLSNAGWTDLGAGPLLLSFTGTGGVYAIGDAQPSFKNEGFTKARGGSVKVQTSSHVWGGAKDNFGVSVYVAPITGGGGAAPGCAEATAYLARATGETAHASDLTTLICGLVTDSVWAKLDTLYILAQQTQADAALNLIGASYGLTVGGGSPAFTAYQGYSMASGAYLTTGFIPSTAPSPKYTQNSASFGYWMYSAIVSTSEIMQAASSGMYYNYPSTPNLTVSSINGPQLNTPSPGTNGEYVADRASSSAHINFYNGVSQGSMAGASAAVDATAFLLGVGGSAQTVSAAHIGASLGAAGQTALYNRLRTYMTSVGVP